ncbi:MAG TPA: cytochrome P450, partial [Flavitalea sp.]|nr:cytochrome P450 [Flavitalea sp.]
MTTNSKIQKAKGYPLIGNTLSAIKDPLGFMTSLRKNYDDFVRIQIGGKNYIVIQSPDASRHVLQENAKNYYKPGAARMMKKVMGNGLATSNGDLWLKQRRLMQPAFHRKKIEGLYQTIREETGDLIQSWKEVPLVKPINVS